MSAVPLPRSIRDCDIDPGSFASELSEVNRTVVRRQEHGAQGTIASSAMPGTKP